MATIAILDMLKRIKKLRKKSKKVVVLKDEWCYGRSKYNWVVSQDSQPRKSIPKESMKLGSNRAVEVSKCTWRHLKNRERNGPSSGITQKRESHERSPCAPKFEGRLREITSQQEGCARKAAWEMANIN